MSRPPVSVLVTCFNHERYIERALDSVLAQDLPGVELLVADDASADASADRIRAWAERTGAAAHLDLHAVNIGLNRTLVGLAERATGRSLLLLDGDDELEPDALARLWCALEHADDDVAVVYGDARVVDGDDRPVRPSFLDDAMGGPDRLEGDVFHRLQRQNVLPSMAVLVRRDAYDAVGGIDPGLGFEDWDLWLRLADRYRFVCLPGIVATRRELPTSMERSLMVTLPMQRTIVSMHQRWLDRDPLARVQSAFWIRRAASVIARDDRREALALLRGVADVPTLEGDEPAWAGLAAVLSVPGSERAMPALDRLHTTGRRLWHAERQAWRGGRRLRRPRPAEAGPGASTG